MITGNVLLQLFQEARRLIAAHLRHDTIEHDEVEVVTAEFLEPFAPARSSRDGVPVAAQVGGENLENGWIVIDDENVERRFRTGFRYVRNDGDWRPFRDR